MKKQTKKGFTIVELVIVIALIAILAAVLIPTFSNVINNAHESSDTMMVKNLNTILNAEEVNGNRAETMQEAVDQAEEGGYKVDKLTPTSTGDIVWDQVSNRFLLVNAKKEVVYKDESATGDVDLTNGAYKLWKITRDATKEDKGYSLYLAKDYKGGDLANLTVTAGVDVGEHNDVATISYTGTEAARKIIFRTNGGTLTVDGAKDTVNHYGASDYTDIKAVANASYHEHGVVAYVRIAAGHYVAESTAKVINLNVAASSVTVSESAGAKVVAYSKGSNDVTVAVNGATKEVTDVKSEADIVKEAANSAVVAENGVAEIDGVQYKTLQAALNSAKAGNTVKLVADTVVDTATAWLKCKTNVTIDFNGFSVRNTVDIWSDSANALLVFDGCEVVLMDSSTLKNGGIDPKADDCYGMTMKNGAKVTIKSGSYIGNISAVQVEEGELVITGGKFDLKQKWPLEKDPSGYWYEINCIDGAYKDRIAKVSIEGGVFVGFNPSSETEANAPKSYLAEGYTVTSTPLETAPSILVYTVVKAD